MPHAGVLALYHELLALRRREPALRDRARERFAAVALGDRALALRRAGPDGSAFVVVVALGDGAALALDGRAETCAPAGRRWTVALGSEEPRFGGEEPLAPFDGVTVTLPSAGALVLRA